MRINLITQEEYETLVQIQKEFPALTYQAKGYDQPNYDKFTEEDNEAFLRVSEILKANIVGFRRFQNFSLSKNGEPRVRFQYNYNYDEGLPFQGVGYITIEELLHGFAVGQGKIS